MEAGLFYCLKSRQDTGTNADKFRAKALYFIVLVRYAKSLLGLDLFTWADEPKTAALPLGDAPALRCAEHSHKNAGPQARAFVGDRIAETTWEMVRKIYLTRCGV